MNVRWRRERLRELCCRQNPTIGDTTSQMGEGGSGGFAHVTWVSVVSFAWLLGMSARDMRGEEDDGVGHRNETRAYISHETPVA
jgi:hypothetical protein